MAYLTLVGNIPGNKGGIGARGYHVYRRGTSVHVVWGGIETRRGQMVSLAWARTTQYKIHRCRSIAAALALSKRLIWAQIEQGYSRLPPGTRIYRPSAIGSSLRR